MADHAALRKKLSSLGRRSPGMSQPDSPSKYYPHLTVEAAQVPGLGSMKIGKTVTARIQGRVTSMHMGEGQPHEVGMEVRRMALMRKLKQEKARRIDAGT